MQSFELAGGDVRRAFTPENVQALANGVLQQCLERDAPKILATAPEYPVSTMDFMAPTDWRDPRLAEREAAGGKIIVYHGPSDGAFSLQASIDWYEKVRANNGGDANRELPQGWSPTRSRPLCDWPTVARYRGTGDFESVASFTCE